VRERWREVKIETIPGPSALAAALSIAGMRAASFTFYGFLPLKKGREKLMKEIAASERASIFYESPHRIVTSLSNC
jgi:16S rRNA (cytidine1402-2'-O)-methyltransferase